jgi:catechol O-methyltransferase
MELGTYVGYSALRIARKLPEGGRLFSVEFNAHNAAGDGGKTIEHLSKEIGPGGLDLVFLDHAKDAYVTDLQSILSAGWLHGGSVAVADNVGFPGRPNRR